MPPTDPTPPSRVPALSRRRLLAATAGAVLAPLMSQQALATGLPAGSAGAAEAAPAVPNILWFLSEDNNPYIGAYGDPLARTPTIDTLAAKGILYRNAFCPAPVCAPSRFALLTGVHAESAGPAENMRATGEIPESIRGIGEYLREAGYYTTNNYKTDYNADIDLAATWNANGLLAHWRNRPAGAPFYSVFTSMTTHESALIADIATPVTDPAAVRVPAYLPDTLAVRRDRARYYDLVAAMDGELASRLKELDSAGVAEDTIVFYLADNGGVLPWSKRFANDAGLRVPLIAYFPDKWAHLASYAPGSVAEEPVDTTDLAPTALSLAGVAIPEYVQGQSLAGVSRDPARQYAFGMRNRMDERYDMVRTVTDGQLRYIRNYTPHRIYGQHTNYMWQQTGYKVWEQAHLDGTLDDVQERFWSSKPAEELYDYAADPDGLDNLVDDPSRSADLDRLRTALDAYLIEINDNGFIPEGAALEGYDDSRVPGAYPIEDVIELAGQAIQRDASLAGYFAGRLGDANLVIRYWAAQGLLILGPDAAPQLPALEQRWEVEDSPQVKVALAEVLVNLGSAEPVFPWLADTLKTSDSVPVRLQAVNALTYIGDAAKAVLPAIDFVTLLSGNEYLFAAGSYLGTLLRGTYTP
ncbi:sulfatase-like hydrolase/transferase [Streptomyces fuscichromogenes]|uniref:sulfatase-like hydrolase/transferase n=1 Tax=Streptomyces fuscichromogenes TaxID=1324013 RepID=UPI00380A3B7C